MDSAVDTGVEPAADRTWPLRAMVMRLPAVRVSGSSTDERKGRADLRVCGDANCSVAMAACPVVAELLCGCPDCAPIL